MLKTEMKTAQRSYRTRSRSRSNHGLLMLGIVVLDCGMLFLCVLVCGLLLMLMR